MAIARKYIMDKDRPGYYLISNRCVRQMFNLGKGPGEKLERERKLFMEELLQLLCFVFIARLISFSFMDNHYHMVVSFDPARILKLSDEEVARMVLKLDAKCPNRRLWSEEQRETWVQELIKDRARLRQWRKTLSDPSKFMAYFNEVVAKRFNEEDGCKGHFWQSRFHSVKLEDFGAVLLSASYVDLNPVRAGVCGALIESPHTAIRYRLGAQQEGDPGLTRKSRDLCESLCAVEDWFTDCEWAGAPIIEFGEYFRLLEEMGRMHHEGKGSLSEESAGILARFDLTENAALISKQLLKKISYALGSPRNMRKGAKARGRNWHHGVRKTAELYLN
jgi:REP element-mobilizing transposase RayT